MFHLLAAAGQAIIEFPILSYCVIYYLSFTNINTIEDIVLATQCYRRVAQNAHQNLSKTLSVFFDDKIENST